jgi:hypothetical protein
MSPLGKLRMYTRPILYVNNYNSMALVCKQTMPTERPPLVREDSANFCGWRGVACSARPIPAAVILVF